MKHINSISTSSSTSLIGFGKAKDNKAGGNILKGGKGPSIP